MTVPQTIKTQVEAELKKCIEVLERNFKGFKFPMPVINYTQRGTDAGTAEYSNWSINLNPGLLLDPRYTTEMIEQTAPHELAHLVTFKVYPETMERSPQPPGRPYLMKVGTRNGAKRGRREVHGPRWQYVMRVMGKNPARCHTMDTSNVRTRERVRYDWKCTGCGQVIQLGPKHNKAQEQRGTVFHKGCRGYKLVKPGAQVSAAPRPLPVLDRSGFIVPGANKPTPKPASQPLPSPASKLDLCKRLYAANQTMSRSNLIALFVQQAGCTAAGASSYYSSIKKAFA